MTTSPKMDDRLTREQEIREAVARGWCDPANSHKEMDVILAESIVREVLALRQDSSGGVTAARVRQWAEEIIAAIEPQRGALGTLESAAKVIAAPPALPDEVGEMVRRLRDKFLHQWTGARIAATCDEAASLIERLAPRWISVEERLPEDYQIVIVAGGIAYRKDVAWFTLTGEEHPGRLIQWTVTHWRPLPNPPQKGST